MNFSPSQQAAARTYRQVHTETRVSEANPHQLVCLLYEGLQSRIATARGALKRGDIAGKGHAIGMAVRIVEEGLKVGLQGDPRDPLVAALRNLYDCITARLTLANLHNDDALLEQCGLLIEPVRQAWLSIGRESQDSAPAPLARLAA